MGRNRRPDHEGLFHVTARSNAQEHIFRNSHDYETLIGLLAWLVEEGFLQLHEFCVMPTHHHLLGTFKEGMLAPFCHRLHRRYALAYNERHQRRGRVFDGPYKSVPVVDEVHGQWVHEYIANNPSRRPWPWSSFDRQFSFVEPLPWAAALRKRLVRYDAVVWARHRTW